MEQQVYNEDSIEYLTDIDHIRTRPGMYIGELFDPRHLLVEAIDNSVDEVLSGYCSKITVKVTQVNNKYVYSVEDTGRGIPIGLKPSPSNPDKLVSTLEIVTRYARSGGKFDNKSYKVRGGLHGVGTCVISSLSTYAKFETTRDKSKNQIIYIQKSLSDNNEVKDYNYEEVGSTTYMAFEEDNALDHVGTRVTFVPDDTKFNSCKIPLDFIVNKCKICNAQYNNVVSLYYLDEEIDVNTTFKDLVIRPEDTESIYCEKLFEVGVLGNSAKIWLEYNSSTKYSMRSFCNLIETYDGGTHYKDLIKSIENVWSEFLEKESEVKFHKDDCRVGLYGVLSISIGDPQFSSQTKEKLTVSSESLSYIFSEFEKSLREWLVANEDIRKALIRRFEIYRQEKDRMSVTKDIMKLIKVNNTSSDGHIKRKSVVPKLVECSQTKVDNTEVYFVEGNSAGGCFTGDTRVRLANGTSRDLVSLIDDLNHGIKHYTYSSTPDGEVSIQEILGGSCTIKNSKLVEVVIDNGEVIRCTPDHPFLLRSGKYEKAENLSAGTSLMALNFKLSGSPVHVKDGNKYEFYFDNKCQKWLATHRVVASTYLEKPTDYKVHIHHSDLNSLNNYPYNLEYMESSEHRRFHAKLQRTDPEYCRKISESSRELMTRPENVNRIANIHRDKMKSDPEYKERVVDRLRNYWSKEESRVIQSDTARNSWDKNNGHNRDKYSEMNKSQWITKSIELCNTIINNGINLSEDSYMKYRTNSSFQLRWDTLLKKLGGYDSLIKYLDTYNHKVVSVSYLDYTEDVYDITVNKYHNFLLDSGVFVHNTAARARNSRLQAVLPLRGKIKNITNVSIKTALQSEEVRWIVNTAGCGVGDSCDVSKSRYSKYIINSDSDVDGLHIVVLVLSVFINIMPELVKQGYVYVALPPLYGYQIKGKYYYANDMKDIPENLRATKSFTRFKGLGEMNDDQYEETCMNPETRHIMKVEYPDDIERFNRIVGSSVGRRELLSELGLLVNITDRQDKD